MKTKRIIIYGLNLIYNAFLFYITWQIVEAFLFLFKIADTREIKILYGILLLISLLSIRIPTVSLKHFNSDSED